ncbi:MAG: AraC family transcriptional regulator [Proteobacteria bacterium]|nr:AraC family transcriptional regulator [Pseudomonadota bacterium]
MEFGEHYLTHVDPALEVDLTSKEVLGGLRDQEIQITQLNGCPDESSFLDRQGIAASKMSDAKLIFFKINDDCFMEITESRVHWPTVCRNRIGDIISFQFVSSVSRSEILGDTTNIHDLGPAIICTATPQTTMSYRVPTPGAKVNYVVVHTTLSNLLQRLNESPADYPPWLIDCIANESCRPEQRVFFSDISHWEVIRPCFELPVNGNLVSKWLTGKFWELLTIGLQSLKDNVRYRSDAPVHSSTSELERFRSARRILDMQYSNPPSLAELAKRLGLSETRLKSGFKNTFGMTTMQYCLQKRIDAARLLLEENHLSISQIANTVGYEDPSAFSRAFKRITRQTPKECRSGQAAGTRKGDLA